MKGKTVLCSHFFNLLHIAAYLQHTCQKCCTFWKIGICTWNEMNFGNKQSICSIWGMKKEKVEKIELCCICSTFAAYFGKLQHTSYPWKILFLTTWNFAYGHFDMRNKGINVLCSGLSWLLHIAPHLQHTEHKTLQFYKKKTKLIIELMFVKSIQLTCFPF